MGCELIKNRYLHATTMTTFIATAVSATTADTAVSTATTTTAKGY